MIDSTTPRPRGPWNQSSSRRAGAGWAARVEVRHARGCALRRRAPGLDLVRRAHGRSCLGRRLDRVAPSCDASATGRRRERSGACWIRRSARQRTERPRPSSCAPTTRPCSPPRLRDATVEARSRRPSAGASSASRRAAGPSTPRAAGGRHGLGRPPGRAVDARTMSDGTHAYGKATLRGVFARLLRGLAAARQRDLSPTKGQTQMSVGALARLAARRESARVRHSGLIPMSVTSESSR
jgi:hypothetical protein